MIANCQIWNLTAQDSILPVDRRCYQNEGCGFDSHPLFTDLHNTPPPQKVTQWIGNIILTLGWENLITKCHHYWKRIHVLLLAQTYDNYLPGSADLIPPNASFKTVSIKVPNFIKPKMLLLIQTHNYSKYRWERKKKSKSKLRSLKGDLHIKLRQSV